MKRVIILISAIFVSLTMLSSAEGFGGLNLKRKFLEPSEAFKATAIKKGDYIDAQIKLGNKIHIYAKDLHFKVVKPEQFELNVKKPKPVDLEGDKVYYGTLDFKIPVKEIESKVKGPYTIQIDMSGCSDSGICYQPQKFSFDFNATGKSGVATNINQSTPTDKEAEKTVKAEAQKSDKEGFFSKVGKLSSEGNSAKIAKALADENLLFILMLFFVAGLLLALTPCILPMIPILSSIILKQAGKEGQVSRSTSFLISAVYVVSMSASYAMIGVIAGLLGFDLQAHMNNPWVIIPMSALFIALALSLFGYFELQLPASIQSKLTRASDNAQGKGLVGTAIMGALSALVVGTCTAPVISGAIIFISMTGNALLGGISLFVMGIGAGMPLLLVGLGADKLVPKPGGWMTRVSQIFGVAMLMMALYVMRGILSEEVYMILFAMIFIGSALFMEVFDINRYQGAWKIIQILAFVFLLYGSMLFIGGISGANSITDPLSPFKGGKSVMSTEKESVLIPMAQRKGYTLSRLQSEIASAGKPVIVDIGKKNCAACTELEHITFPDKKVQDAMKRFKFIQIDITDNTPAEQKILKHYGLFGAPNILIFDSKGKALPEKFLTGFVKPEDFVKHINTIK